MLPDWASVARFLLVFEIGEGLQQDSRREG